MPFLSKKNNAASAPLLLPGHYLLSVVAVVWCLLILFLRHTLILIIHTNDVDLYEYHLWGVSGLRMESYLNRQKSSLMVHCNLFH